MWIFCKYKQYLFEYFILSEMFFQFNLLEERGPLFLCFFNS